MFDFPKYWEISLKIGGNVDRYGMSSSIGPIIGMECRVDLVREAIFCQYFNKKSRHFKPYVEEVITF